MTYRIDGYEKWKVYIKSEYFMIKEVDERFGIEIGITGNYSFEEAINSENKIENIRINLIDNDCNKDFHNEIIKLQQREIKMFFIGMDSEKVLYISGNLNRELKSGKWIKYNIRSGKSKKSYNLNITINY
ncbi:MAG TPA: hypothetical protein ENL20_11800 [Candidatus Cloacimonetes bacterium]|nr:hypothetical protein [Candidatus Cloacimonadota bacterium]